MGWRRWPVLENFTCKLGLGISSLCLGREVAATCSRGKGGLVVHPVDDWVVLGWPEDRDGISACGCARGQGRGQPPCPVSSTSGSWGTGGPWTGHPPPAPMSRPGSGGLITDSGAAGGFWADKEPVTGSLSPRPACLGQELLPAAAQTMRQRGRGGLGPEPPHPHPSHTGRRRVLE